MEGSGLVQGLRQSESVSSRFVREGTAGRSVAYLRADVLANKREWGDAGDVDRRSRYQGWAKGVWQKRLGYSTE